MSSSQPRLQPQPPSSPTHNESRRSSAKAGRVVKCSLKSKTASTNSVCKTDDGSDTTTKTLMVQKGEQKPQEPRTTCTLAQPTKIRRAAKDDETHFDGKGDHTDSLSANGPEEQPKDEDMTLGSCLEQIPGVTCDGASHTSKPEVRAGSDPTHSSSLDPS